MMAPDDCDDDGCTRRCKSEKNILCDQEEQFLPYEPEAIVRGKNETEQQKKEREWQEKRRENQEKQSEQLEKFYDSGPREDGTSHAGVMEHVSFFGKCVKWAKNDFFTNFGNFLQVMQLTTHRVMSPRLRAAMESVSALIGFRMEKKSDLEKILELENGSGKAHLMALMEAEFEEGESKLRTYRDPRAETAMNNARIFAAGRLRKALR